MRSVITVSALLALVGCSGGEAAKPTATAKKAATSSAPGVEEAIGAAAERFLASVVAGDAAEAMRWLTPTAAARAANDPTVLAPLGFAVGSLDVGEVRLVADGEAAAQCWLTEPGAEQREEVCCLLKDSPAGWRVCGLACDAGPGEPPAVISFEPPVPSQNPPRRKAVTGQFVDGSPAPEPRTAASGAASEIR